MVAFLGRLHVLFVAINVGSLAFAGRNLAYCNMTLFKGVLFSAVLHTEECIESCDDCENFCVKVEGSQFVSGKCTRPWLSNSTTWAWLFGPGCGSCECDEKEKVYFW